MRINIFYTVHRPKQHSAHLIAGSGTLVDPQPTEIELVRKLKHMGINLKEFEFYNNRGDEKHLVVNWKRK